MTTTLAPAPLRSAADVHGYIERVCFKSGPPHLVGAELEWIVQDTTHPRAVVPIARIDDALRQAGNLPGAA